jgi:hypothetical protein
MQPVETEGQQHALQVRQQVKQVLESERFARAEQLCRFLRFVVERHLEGRDDELKESVIGVEVFGRRTDYNPHYDPIVRTHARRLRSRLSEYYDNEGKSDPLVIELPRGAYVPVFRDAAERVAAPAPSPATGRRLRHMLAAASLFIIATAAAWWWIQRNRVPVTIAVLPLINLSQDSANEYFADGLTTEIIRNLSILDGLAVRSQTSSFTFKGKTRNMREAGKQLDADYILEGSVLRDGQRLQSTRNW